MHRRQRRGAARASRAGHGPEERDRAGPVRRGRLRQGRRHRPGIEEGRRAGMWTVGLLLSGNAAGLTLEEYLSLDEAGRDAARAGRRRAVRRRAALPDRHGGRPAGGDLRHRTPAGGGPASLSLPAPDPFTTTFRTTCAAAIKPPRDLHQSFPLIHGVHMNRYKLLALAAALSGVMGAASAETTLTVSPRWKPTRSRPTRPRSRRPTPTSRSSGYAIPPASSPPSSWPRRTTQGRRHLGPGRHLAGPDGQGRHAAALRSQGPGPDRRQHA